MALTLHCASVNARGSTVWRAIVRGVAMTHELQTAMARYEAARLRYRVAVIATFRTAHGGEAIRAAIRECQEAGAALEQLTSPRRDRHSSPHTEHPR